MRGATSCCCWCLPLLVVLGCRPTTIEPPFEPPTPDAQAPSTARDSSSIVGTWKVVSVQLGDRDRPDLAGARWTFDGRLLHELYGEHIAHAPHGPREYHLEMEADPPHILLESYGGCIIEMEHCRLELDNDRLQLTQGGALLTMRRISTKPQAEDRNSHEAAKALMERAPEEAGRSEIDGVWRRTSMHYRGRELTPDVGSMVRFSSGRMTYLEQRQASDGHSPIEPPPARVYFELDPTTQPKQIDKLIDSTDGVCGGWHHTVGIYRIEGERLYILSVLRGQRPASFTNYIGDDAVLWVYERAAERERR
ncbi:MAG: hypothetical protein RIC55_00670 [Pirellulaceae bacterium]